MSELAAKKVSGFGTDKGQEQKPNESGHYRTAQTMFLSDADIQAVTNVLAEAVAESADPKTFDKIAAKDLQKRAADKGYRPVPIDIALFGRMVTSEAFVNVEASCQFAHAISTHKIDHEFDYYTAVDDLERAADDEAGAGADMIGDVEFNSACYYKYFNLHVEGFVDNLTGKAFRGDVSSADEQLARQTAGKAVRVLIEAACRVTPSGKQNSFAAHQPPSFVWIEIRDKNLPISYANAFSMPVNPKGRNGLELESGLSLKKECRELTDMYDLEARRRLLLTKYSDLTILDTPASKNLKEILDAVETEVLNG